MKRRSRYRRILLWTALGLAGLALVSAVPSAVATAGRVEHNFAENDGLRLHYVARGEGPLLVLIHGIPNSGTRGRHRSARSRRATASSPSTSAAFNRSDAPVNQEGYRAEHLVEDVAAVIRAEGHEQATVIGHDSGAFVAWHFAATHPDMTERLVALSVPHPNAFVEELANNPAQHAAGGYARQMQQPGATAAFRVGPSAFCATRWAGRSTSPQICARITTPSLPFIRPTTRASRMRSTRHWAKSTCRRW